MNNKNVAYSKKIDNVIYNKITENFDRQDFLDLALASLDQWVSLDDNKAIFIIRKLEKLTDKNKIQILEKSAKKAITELENLANQSTNTHVCYWCDDPILGDNVLVKMKQRPMHEDCYQNCLREIHEKPEN